MVNPPITKAAAAIAVTILPIVGLEFLACIVEVFIVTFHFWSA